MITMVMLRTLPSKKRVYILPLNVLMCKSAQYAYWPKHQLTLDYELTVFNSKGRYRKLAIEVNTLLNIDILNKYTRTWTFHSIPRFKMKCTKI